MDDDELDSLVASISSTPSKPAAATPSANVVTQEMSIDDIDAFMADMDVGGPAARAQSTKKPVIKRKNKYTAAGAASGPELDQLLEILDPKQVDLTSLSKGICFHCQNNIYGDTVACIGKLYHPEHIFCSSCGQRDEKNQYFERDRQVVCSKCQLQQTGIYCRGCGQGILTVSIDALGAKWHPECFVCSNCRNQFTDGSYAMREGKPVCQACAQSLQICRSCKKVINGLAIHALGGYFHKEGTCYSCQTCYIPIGPGFCNLDGLPYCEIHFLEKKGIAICAHCTKPISGAFINAVGKKFHSDHFLCTLCRTRLGANYMEDAGKPYCNACATAL